jgi:hypothetical protein
MGSRTISSEEISFSSVWVADDVSSVSDEIFNDRKGGWITTFSREEGGSRVKFEAPLDFFPSEGHIVKLSPPENAKAGESAENVWLYNP